MKIMHYIFYELVSGRIVRECTVDEEFKALMQPDNTEAFENLGPCNPATDYIEGGVITSRPVMGLSMSSQELEDGIGINTDFEISNIPLGATLIHPDGEEVLNDTTLKWQSSVPGEFILHFKYFPYIEELLRVKVN